MGQEKSVVGRWASKLVAGATLAALGFGAQATVVAIDNFNFGAGSLSINTGTANTSTLGLPGGSTVGGERDMLIANTGALAGVSANFSPPHQMTFVTAYSMATFFRLEWDGTDGAIAANNGFLNYTGLGGLDLWTNVGWKALLIDVVSTSNAPTVTFEFYSDATHWSYRNVTLSTTGVVAVPFSSFIQGGSAGPVNWSNVGAIVMYGSVANTTVFPVLVSNFSLRGVSVPEPGTLVLLSMGMLALGAWAVARRRPA